MAGERQYTVAWTSGSVDGAPPSPRRRPGWAWPRRRRSAAEGVTVGDLRPRPRTASKRRRPRSAATCIPLVARRRRRRRRRGVRRRGDRGARRRRHPRHQRRWAAGRQLRVDAGRRLSGGARPQPDVGRRRWCKAAVTGDARPRLGHGSWRSRRSSVRQPMAELILSNTARAGATGFLKTRRPRGRRHRGHGQLGAARPAPHARVTRALRGRQPPRRRASATPTTSAASSRSCAASRRSSSPAPRSTSTAARTRRCSSAAAIQWRAMSLRAAWSLGDDGPRSCRRRGDVGWRCRRRRATATRRDCAPRAPMRRPSAAPPAAGRHVAGRAGGTSSPTSARRRRRTSTSCTTSPAGPRPSRPRQTAVADYRQPVDLDLMSVGGDRARRPSPAMQQRWPVVAIARVAVRQRDAQRSVQRCARSLTGAPTAVTLDRREAWPSTIAPASP